MNITELKEKLTKYSRDNVSCSNHYNNIPWQYVNNISFENVHSVGYHQGQKDKAEQDAKTITALLEIIENLQMALAESTESLYLIQEDNEHYFENKCIPTSDEINQIRLARKSQLETLTATEIKLKELGEG